MTVTSTSTQWRQLLSSSYVMTTVTYEKEAIFEGLKELQTHETVMHLPSPSQANHKFQSWWIPLTADLVDLQILREIFLLTHSRKKIHFYLGIRQRILHKLGFLPKRFWKFYPLDTSWVPKKRWLLLLFDEYLSHLSVELAALGELLGIFFVCLHANAIQLIQLLDIAAFSAFSRRSSS